MEADTLDNFIKNSDYKGKVGYIKSDIEGDESNIICLEEL